MTDRDARMMLLEALDAQGEQIDTSANAEAPELVAVEQAAGD